MKKFLESSDVHQEVSFGTGQEYVLCKIEVYEVLGLVHLEDFVCKQ